MIASNYYYIPVVQAQDAFFMFAKKKFILMGSIYL